MRKKFLTVFALLLLLLCACSQTKKELTFEEKMKLPGYSEDPDYFNSPIKTFAKYEKHLIKEGKDYAAAIIRCDKVIHYLVNHKFDQEQYGFVSFSTGNTVTVTKIIRSAGAPDVFTEDMRIEFFQPYGYRPESSEEFDWYFIKELCMTRKDFTSLDNGFRVPIQLNGDYHFFMRASDQAIVPLDEGEEYLILLKSDISPESNTRKYYYDLICPLNVEKYKNVFNGKGGFSFLLEDLNLLEEFWNAFMD